MAAGHEQGCGFLRNVVIDPHLTQAKRDNELVDVTDAHPELLGIGIDEDAALVVHTDTFEVIGTGRVAIYDNLRHDRAWYYWLIPHDSFNLANWEKLAPKH
jgi:cyanophycinase